MEPEYFYHLCLLRLFPEASSHWADIATAYGGRAYHNLDHLREMLSHLPALHPFPAPAAAASTPSDPWSRRAIADLGAAPKVPLTAQQALFGLALIYHDIVYKAGRKDNEARSADLLEEHIKQAGGKNEHADYCRKLIMATKAHKVTDPTDDFEALLVDLDLAVLARPSKGYDAYAEAVRHEFRWFPDFLYRPGRRKALGHLLDQPHLYQLADAREMWEVDARANLTRELKKLR